MAVHSSLDPDHSPERRSWRARARRWARPPRQLSLTTSGKFFILLTLGVGFGAVNTGNNLLFLLLGMMMSLILASGVLSEAVLRDLKVRRRAPSRLSAGASCPGAYVVDNPMSWPSLSVSAGDRLARGLRGPRRGTTVGPERISWWKVWRRAPKDAPAPVASAYALRIAPGGREEIDARFELETRGVYRLPEIELTTRFPFGLFEKSRIIDDEAVVLVAPAPIDAADWAAEVRGAFGDVPANRRGRGDEFYGLREHRPGEDRRRIHWKVSARRGELVVREDEARVQRSLEIVLCDYTGLPSVERGRHLAAFERAVGKTAGLILRLNAEGHRIGLRTSHGAVAPGLGSRHVDQLLAALAEVELGDEPGDFDAGPAEARADAARLAIGTAEALARLPFGVDRSLPLDEQGSKP